MLNEKGLAAVMRDKWRGGGYVVAESEGMIMLNLGAVLVCCEKQRLPRKCLGLIAEHVGEIPQELCYKVSKAAGAHTMLLEDEIETWEKLRSQLIDPGGSRILPTQLQMNGNWVWQKLADLRVVLVDPGYTRVIEAEFLADAWAWDVFSTGLIWDGGDCIAAVMPLTRNDTDRRLQQLDGFPWCGEAAE